MNREMMNAPLQIGNPEITEAIDAMVEAVVERHARNEGLALVSIANGGIELGRRLVFALERRWGRKVDYGIVNTTFHRDDLARKPIPKAFQHTDLPFYVDDRTILLVDDVIHTGRTLRAALNEIFDQGRPSVVELAVLCDRGGRVLPFQPDYVGLEFFVGRGQDVSVALDESGRGEDKIELLEPAMSS